MKTRLVTTIFSAFMLAAPALAQEGHGEAHEAVGAIPTQSQGIASAVTALVVFALVFAVLAVKVWPTISTALDERANILTVGSGAVWADILPYLDAHGRSVAVMQSNNSFTVGGSLSVNCHGWQAGNGPFVTTVESFRLMTADGEVRTCSRGENAELFGLVAGGYGLFGVVLDVRLRVVPNVRYRRSRGPLQGAGRDRQPAAR